MKLLRTTSFQPFEIETSQFALTDEEWTWVQKGKGGRYFNGYIWEGVFAEKLLYIHTVYLCSEVINLGQKKLDKETPHSLLLMAIVQIGNARCK